MTPSVMLSLLSEPYLELRHWCLRSCCTERSLWKLAATRRISSLENLDGGHFYKSWDLGGAGRILPRLKSWILLFILVIPQTLKSQCFAGICDTTVQQAFIEQVFLVQRWTFLKAGGTWWCTPLIPAYLCEFETVVVYTVSSRTASGLERHPYLITTKCISRPSYIIVIILAWWGKVVVTDSLYRDNESSDNFLPYWKKSPAMSYCSL